MAEHTEDYEWRGEGKNAEIVLYATDDAAFERVLPAVRAPGLESPVYAAASNRNLGWVAASSSHVAPDLISLPVRYLLVGSGVPVESLGTARSEIPRLISRNIQEVRLPGMGGAGVRGICEAGASRAAEDGLIEEDDLPFFGMREGDPDALRRQALIAGGRDWDRLGEIEAYAVREIHGTERAEEAGIEVDALAFVLRIGTGDLGRLALAGHRERILGRVWSRDLGSEPDLPAAPLDDEAAVDLLAAMDATANFADGHAALSLYALRRSLENIVGELDLRASWMVGGIEAHRGLLVHRRGLAAADEGNLLVSGSDLAAGTGKMWGSAPPFGIEESEERWPWEEAGLLERLARLDLLGG